MDGRNETILPNWFGHTPIRNNMRVVSFFAGCGGLDLGFEQAGFDVIWANEIEPSVVETYRLNHPQTEFVLGDINEIDPQSSPNCDGFIGGPPCQSWSIAGKQRGLEDERGQLFLTYIKIIKAKKPKFFLIENVKGLLEEMFKDVFDMFLQQLERSGYDVNWNLLDAANYGVPQNRERVFIIGFRKDLNIDYNFPQSTYSEPITLIRAIGDIKETPVRYQPIEKVESNSVRFNHDVLASEFCQFYHRGNRRRGWHQPSFTIHATADNIPLHPSSPKMMYYGHENWDFQKDRMNEYRRFSVRECARIQTFPDGFRFVTDDVRAAYKMIGNAVPPRLGKVLAQSIMSVLQNVRFESTAITAKGSSEFCVLVGYFKNAMHHDRIIANRLYYVRSDGRAGSIFKEDCDTIPKYLLLHHKDTAEIYELETEEPLLANASYLKTLGFECSGTTYLCFRLKDGREIKIKEFGSRANVPLYDKSNYAPYFTELSKIIS